MDVELLSVLNVLKPTRCKQGSDLTNSDFNYRLNSLLYEHKDIFQGMGALKNVELSIQIYHSVQPWVQKPRRLPILMKKQVENEIQNLLQQDFVELVTSSTESFTWVGFHFSLCSEEEWECPLVCRYAW